jgi:hypothetical protein
MFVFERIRICDDGFSILIDQYAQPAGITRRVKKIVHAGFAVDPYLVYVGKAFSKKFDKSIILTHRNLHKRYHFALLYHTNMFDRMCSGMALTRREKCSIVFLANAAARHTSTDAVIVEAEDTLKPKVVLGAA